jgi:hypothetical protein
MFFALFRKFKFSSEGKARKYKIRLTTYAFYVPPLTLIRMTKDEKGLAFFKGLLL